MGRGPKKEETTPRMQWYAQSPNDMKQDPRMKIFTQRERSFWLAMINDSFADKGMMVTAPDVVASQTGATLKEAKLLVNKLYQSGLITQDGADEHFDAVSPRMASEYAIALAVYERYAKLGKSGGEAKAALHCVK